MHLEYSTKQIYGLIVHLNFVHSKSKVRIDKEFSISRYNNKLKKIIHSKGLKNYIEC